MDMSENDKLEVEKRNAEPLSHSSPGLSGDWQYKAANFGNSSMGLISNGNDMTVCGDAVGPSCSSGSMVDSFDPAGWEHSAPLGFTEMNVHNGAAGASDSLSILKGGMFLPGMSGMLPHSLSQVPADSAFIERAARFSSFSGGHFGDMLNPFGIQHSVNPYVRGGAIMQVPQELMPVNAMKNLHGRQPHKNVVEATRDVSLPAEHGAVDGNSTKSETMANRSRVEAKQRTCVSGNDSEEPEFSGSGAQEDGTPLSAKGLGAKKRKRGNQVTEPDQTNGVQQHSDEAGQNSSEIQEKGEQNSQPSGNKSNRNNGKQSSQTSDPQKEEYIHVRARRGQATNSHSLAERVRREKISERMKFLQDLVPSCSKVTGKAVMLDEIINYVQSLQRQVEFLSMKLATVNSRLDISIESLLAKDMFTGRGGSSGLGIAPDMSLPYSQLHPSQSPMLQPGLPGMGNCSDILRRAINSHLTNMVGTYKEPTSQLPDSWDGELHNLVQMGFNPDNISLDNQENNSSVSPSQMKAEP